MAVKREFKKRMNEIMLTLILDELGDAAQPGHTDGTRSKVFFNNILY